MDKPGFDDAIEALNAVFIINGHVGEPDLSKQIIFGTAAKCVNCNKGCYYPYRGRNTISLHPGAVIRCGEKVVSGMYAEVITNLRKVFDVEFE